MSEKRFLPPNQQLAAQGKWPIVGEKSPRRCDEPWRVSVGGLVLQPRTWTLDEIAAMPRVERVIDIHCVTRWTKLGAHFNGVPLSKFLDQCKPLQEARFISFSARSEQNHSTSLTLDDALRLDALVALEYEGEPLEAIHGGPIRMVVPGKYFYKSVKWLERIELLAEDSLGYWEREAGYHNGADPWREQRYIAPNLDKRTLGEALAKRDFRGKNFQSLDARGLDLSGLNARGALLRAANFQRINLERACFDEANLSNALMQGSNLRHATFLNADVEGANFLGADLRGADFTGASIFGATFCPEESGDDERESFGPSILDHTTLIDEAAMNELTPLQETFVRQALKRESSA